MEGYIDRHIKTFQDQIKILRQLITEIKKFHDEDRVIGNLGPFNIYVNIVDKQFAIRPDIKLDSGWSHYWTQNTKDTDIFLLGCVFYFILSRGKHPFGYVSQCQLMEKNLFYLGSCKNIHIRTLIQRMIHFDPQKRPTITDVCNHLMFREPNLIASFLGEYANEDPQLIDEYCPVKYSDFLSTASHRFDGSKLERKAETVSIRPGRLKDFYVDVIVATEVEDEQLIRYYTSLFKLSANSSFVLCPSYELRDNIVR
jgi:serine/threonine protein kinase